MAARRVLIEGAWTYRFSARVGETLRGRLNDLLSILSRASCRTIGYASPASSCAAASANSVPTKDRDDRNLKVSRKCRPEISRAVGVQRGYRRDVRSPTPITRTYSTAEIPSAQCVRRRRG